MMMAFENELASGGVGGGGDSVYRKVFVGGLAWETQSETLRRYFEQFGDIFEAVVITDKNTGRSKGYGFVTFRDLESAQRACADPSPVIDGRRANCNLAYLGRTRSPVPSFGRLRPAFPAFGSVQSPRGAYVRSPGHQQPVPYGYQPGLMYPPYGYTPYRPEYVYPQGVYNPGPYVGQPYLQVYGVPGAVNSGVNSHGQLGHPLPGSHNFTAVHSYGMPSHHFLQFGQPNMNGVTTTTVPTIEAPYPSGMPAVASLAHQSQIHAYSPQVPSNSDHTES